MGNIFACFDDKGIESSIINTVGSNMSTPTVIATNQHVLLASNDNNITKSELYSDDKYYIASITRIDNRVELLKQACLPLSASNNQLILHLFNKYHKEAFNKINGGFSIIIYDRSSSEIIVVNDHLNVKPLYYATEGSRFVFSSNIPMLFQSGINKNVIDKNIMLDILISGAPRLGRTIYKNIDCLENNHILSISASKKVTKQRYYRFSYRNDTYSYKEEYYSEKLKKLLFNSIEEKLQQTETNTAFALSGGLDSSSIVCMADSLNKSKSLNKNLLTHSAIFPKLTGDQKKLADESFYIQKVIEKTNVEAKLHKFDTHGSLNILDKITNLAEPVTGVNIYINYKILEELQLSGVKAYFEGIGGDMIISHGHSRFIELSRKFRILDLIRENKAFCEKKNVAFNLYSCLKNYFIYSNMPNSFHRLLYKRQKNVLNFQNLNVFLKKKYQIDLAERWKTIFGYHPRAIASRDYDVYKIEEFGIDNPHINYQSRLINQIGAEHNVEIFTPFLDKRVMSFCLQVPLSLKLKHGESRYYFRGAMQDTLPKEIQNRHWKADVSPGFLKEMLSLSLKETQNLIFCRNNMLNEMLNKNFIVDFYNLFQKERKTTYAVMLYKLIYMSEWLNRRS